jgi:hypothetical protein
MKHIFGLMLRNTDDMHVSKRGLRMEVDITARRTQDVQLGDQELATARNA